MDFESQKNQLNIINIDQERLFQIDPKGNAIFGDTLGDSGRFKLTLTSPGDGKTFYSVAGPDPAAMLRLEELNETKFGRIHFNNKSASEYWQIQSRSSYENPEIRIYWSGFSDPRSFADLPNHTILELDQVK